MNNKKTIINDKPVLRISEAAKMLGITTMTLRRWDQSGYLRAKRVGPRGDRKYTKEQILKVLNNRN